MNSHIETTGKESDTAAFFHVRACTEKFKSF